MSRVGDQARELYADALTWAPADMTVAQLRADLALYGVAFVQDGRRIDPGTVVPTSEGGSGDA